MAKLLDCQFQPGDVIRHKRNRHKGIVYRYINRYKNTGWIVPFNLKDAPDVKRTVSEKRRIKIQTLNFNYEIDQTYKVLYGKPAAV